VKDFEAFCRTTGNDLLESRAEGKQFEFLIKRTSQGGEALSCRLAPKNEQSSRERGTAAKKSTRRNT
jgi:hypothetical protein